MNSMVIIFLTALAFLLSPVDQVQAVTPEQPHDFTCATCHTPHNTLGSTGYDNICLNCHRGGDPRAGAKSFAPGDAADPYGTFNSGISSSYQISHRWDGSGTNPRAGAVAPVQPQMTSVTARTSNALACVRCHNPHSQENKPFLRMANDADQMCVDCHRSRNTGDHTKGSHPVGVTYQQNSPDFKASPVNANPANPTSAVKLIGGKVSCSTCHGVHSIDSNSATFDSFSTITDLKPSDGYLLRTDRRAAAADGINICTNCHAGKVAHNGREQNIQCTDCHGAHVDAGDGSTPNVWLVKRDMGGTRGSVQFTSTVDKNYQAADGKGVCQSCHAVPTGSGFQFHLTQTNATCNDCHTHGNSKGSFSVDAGKACNACHGYPPSANVLGAGGYAAGYQSVTSFVDESTSGHTSHASSPYQKACANCHQGNSHQSGTFQDVFIEPAGTVAATGALTPAYNKSTQTCSNVYCHSNASPRGGNNVTQTTPGWKNGKGAIIGKPGECGFCHSAAGGTSPTWSLSHTKHINGYALNPNFTCNTCHAKTASGNSAVFSNMTARSMHTNGVKDIAFNSFVNGGSWDQSSATCSSVYCHSNVQGPAGIGGATVFTPALTWNSAAMTCGSCHASMVKMANISTATGGHKRHVQMSGFDCSACHGTGYSTTNGTIVVGTHVDGTITMAFTGTAATNGATPGYYQGNNAPGGGYENCSAVYCHSNVQGAGGRGAPTAFAAPVWGSASVQCGSCHANMATSANATGSHVQHVQKTGYNCQTCHEGAGKDTTKHANGTIDLAFSGSAAGTIYSNGPTVAPGVKGYGSCSNANCHGQGAPVWGAAYVAPGTTFPYSIEQCDKCHSGTASAVPFYSTATPKVTAATNAKVGAHTAHLTAAHSLAGTLTCVDCHGAVTSVTSTNHMNGTTDFVFSALAKTGGLSPAYNPANGQCANTYCHGTTLTGGGNSKTPGWTQTISGCDVCHGFPPTTVRNGTGTHPNNSACNRCHTHVNSTNNGFTAAGVSQHINGLVDVSAGSCDSCHGYPPASLSFKGTQNNWSSARAEDYVGGGGAHTVNNHVSKTAKPADGFAQCSKCHSVTDHAMGAAFTPSRFIKVTVHQSVRYESAKQARYTSNRLDGDLHTPGTCSNISCHFGASPVWNQ